MTPVPRVHAVTDDRVLAHRDFPTRLASLRGVDDLAVHVRSRTRPAAELLSVIRRCRELALTVVVNDRVDLALAAAADGIHLPADGLPIESARRLAGPAVWIGCSTHAPDEARAATGAGADYVYLGPIWATASHPLRPPLGIATVAAIPDANVIAIGGVTAARAPDCRRAGAHGIAAISAIWDTPDPGTAARELLLSFLHGLESEAQ